MRRNVADNSGCFRRSRANYNMQQIIHRTQHNMIRGTPMVLQGTALNAITIIMLSNYASKIVNSTLKPIYIYTVHSIIHRVSSYLIIS